MTYDKWGLAGIHGINKYVWSLLQSELGWSLTTYGGLVPITVPQQQPEFNAMNAPYIVYGYTKSSRSKDLYVLETETAAYSIYSASEEDIRRVVNLLSTKLNKLDDSADDVNAWLSTIPTGLQVTNGSQANKEFDYKWIKCMSAQGSQPSIQIGGRFDGAVIIRYEYTQYGTDGKSIRY